VAVTLACAAASLGLGLAITALRRLSPRWIARLLDAFVFVFRGIPVLVLLFLVYFGLPSAGIKVPPLLAMVLSLGVISGAYLSEVFRGALDSVDETETMAAQASGMTALQVFRYVELPQMLRFAVPGAVNELTTILKYTPFAYTVGIPEITKQATTIAATTLQGIQVYLAVGILYFAIYRVLLAVVQAIERHCAVPGIGAVA
jgi:polar amino acid transport system permease protein